MYTDGIDCCEKMIFITEEQSEQKPRQDIVKEEMVVGYDIRMSKGITFWRSSLLMV